MRRRAISATTMTLAAMVTGLMSFMATAASAAGGYPPGPKGPVVAQTLPPAPPVRASAASSSAVAFTGANIMRWALIALVLVVVGSLLAAATRRRVRVAA